MKGQGIRVVKGRSAKQRAHANVFKRGAPRVLTSTTPGPSTSWWIGVSREELRRRAAQEQLRMAFSRFGRIFGSGAQSE